MKGTIVLTHLLLSACADPAPPAAGDWRAKAQETVYAARVSHDAIQVAALQYLALPVCNEATPKLCADPHVADTILVANRLAMTSLDDAERIVRDPTSMQSGASTPISSLRVAITRYEQATAQATQAGKVR